MTNSFLPPPAPTETALSVEIDAIKREAADSGWSRESRDRYRRTVAARDGLSTGDIKTDTEAERGYAARGPEDSRRMMTATSPELVKEWDSAGGFEPQLRNAQGAAMAVLDQLEPAVAGDLLRVFETLPPTIQRVVYQDMALGSPVVYRDADSGLVERFATTSKGRRLVNEWGSRAGRNVAMVRWRLNRMVDRMSPEDGDRFRKWFDDLSTAQVTAIYKAMVK